jgi:hypothetical protein
MARYRRSYSGDPHWITARYPGVCAARDCTQAIARGDRAFYYPNGRALYAAPCGHADTNSRDFEACAFDEDMIGG